MRVFILSVVLFAVVSAALSAETESQVRTAQSDTNIGSITLDLQHSNSHNIALAVESIIQRLQERWKELSGSSSNQTSNKNSTNQGQSEHQLDSQAKLNLQFNIPGRNRENSESSTPPSADE